LDLIRRICCRGVFGASPLKEIPAQGRDDAVAFDAVAFDTVAFDTVAFDAVAFDTVDVFVSIIKWLENEADVDAWESVPSACHLHPLFVIPALSRDLLGFVGI
jgi:hypothetical protein